MPWKINVEADPDLFNFIMFTAGDALRIAGIMLQPTMPEKASQLLDRLGVKADRRSWAYAGKGLDKSFGEPPSEKRQVKWDKLFPPPPTPDTEEWELLEKISEKFKDKSSVEIFQMAEYLDLEARVGEKAAEQIVSQATQ